MDHHTPTTTQKTPHIIIIGCGRLGAELARSLGEQKYSVAIIDAEHSAFERLGANFRGQAVEGEGFDQDVLRRAGIEHAYGFAAVTTIDSINIITCRIARDIYRIPRVIARLYNPTRTSIYQKLNLQTVASSSWGAKRVEQLIMNPNLQSVYSAGNGEVQFFELLIPTALAGKRISEVVTSSEIIPSALIHAGQTQLPKSDTLLEEHDILVLSATAQGASALQKILDQGKKE